MTQPKSNSKRPSKREAEAAIRTLISYVEPEPDRRGLVGTPARVRRAWEEWTSGYGQDPAKILGTTFEEDGDIDQMVVVSGISFVSVCEHHMGLIEGVAHVAYLPRSHVHNGKRRRVVVGLSKIPRVVECFARRLQLQERMGQQIAEAIQMQPKLQPRGVGVVIKARHSCMSTRGVKQPHAAMGTSVLLDMLRDGPARAEFMALAGPIDWR